MSVSKRNSSGYRGVDFSRMFGKWQSRICVRGERIHLGYFETLDEAAKAYEEAAEKYGVKEYLRKNMDINEYNRLRYANNIDRIRQQKREYRKNNSKKCKEWSKEYYQKNREKQLARQKKYNIKVKQDVFNAYGGKCTCCGENTWEFLTLDHKNNDGYKHRQESKMICAANMYKWVRRNNYPDTFTILCWNCNCGRAHTPDKVCPHQKQKGLTSA